MLTGQVSTRLGADPTGAYTVSRTGPSGLICCVVLDVVEVGLLAGEGGPSFGVGVECVAKERSCVVLDDVEGRLSQTASVQIASR